MLQRATGGYSENVVIIAIGHGPGWPRVIEHFDYPNASEQGMVDGVAVGDQLCGMVAHIG